MKMENDLIDVGRTVTLDIQELLQELQDLILVSYYKGDKKGRVAKFAMTYKTE